MTAIATAQPQQAVRQDGALKEGTERVADEARQFTAGAGSGVGNEAGHMLLHQTVQRGLLRAVALAVNRGAIGCTLGLPADGLHDGLPQ